MDIKRLFANTIVKWFKSCGVAGALRWRILYWCYKITGWHIRHKEWDWVLEYLPSIPNLCIHLCPKILDVGSTSSLFIYELARRRYRVIGLDLRPYQEKIHNDRIEFYQQSIIDWVRPYEFNFVTCISVLEHIPDHERFEAIKKMVDTLRVGSRLLITAPTMEYAVGHPWKGFKADEFYMYIPGNCRILEYTERAGQICIAIERKF